MSATDEAIRKAQDKLSAAMNEYIALCPPVPEPKEPPMIEPRLQSCAASSFHRGYNMTLDCGHMPGRIPVVVVPVRACDVKKYRRKTTVNLLLKCLKIYP